MEKTNMTSKEIKEIRKLYTKDRCSVSRLCGCYVSGEKEKLASFTGGLLGMQDDEMFKYLEILKKCLSGSIEKNLFNLEIPLAFELENDAYKLLAGIREADLGNPALMDAFYDKIIETYDHAGNYLILIAHDTYDVPGRSSLGDTMDDASEESYSYLLCAICPVDLGKPGLSFDQEEGWFMAIDRDWIAGAPEAGFLFPAFNDRSTDLHAALYYAKNADALQEELVGTLFGCEIPSTAEEKKNAFGTVVSEVYGREFSPKTMKNVHETLAVEAELIQNEPDMDTALSKTHVRSILEKSGASDEQMKRFDGAYDEMLGNDTDVEIGNIYSKNKFTVKTDSVDLRVNADRTDLVRFEKRGDTMYAIVELEGMTEVNGTPV